MLSIKTNNKNLIIPENIKIAISEINPLFTLDKGSSSLNFVLPGINKKFLTPLHLTNKKIETIDCEISFKSYKKSCKLKFSELSKDKYSCSLLIDFFSFYQKIKDKKLNTLSLGGNRYEDFSDTLKTCFVTDFIIPQIKNLCFMDGTSMEENWRTNIQNQNKISDMVTINGDIYSHKQISPFIYLCYLYEQIFIENGYAIKKNYLRENYHMRNIVLYTNVGMDVYKPNGGTKFVDVDISKALPDIKISDFIKNIASGLNVYPLINEDLKTVRIVSKEEALKSSLFVDITKYVNDDMVKINEEIYDNFSFEIKNCSNDERQNPTVNLSEEKNLVIKDTVNYIENLPTTDNIKDIRLVYYENMYYQYQEDTEETKAWKPFSANIQPYKPNDNEKIFEQKTEFSLLSPKSHETDEYVRIHGNTSYHNSKTDIPFMLAFAYDGDDGFGLYHEHDGLKLTPEGIYNYCWKLTANSLFYSNVKFKVTARLPGNLLNLLQPDNKIKIGNRFYFIETLNYNLESDQITYNKSDLRSI